MPKQFQLSLNLDIEEEANHFDQLYSKLPVSQLAHILGLKGTNAIKLAFALQRYASRKTHAARCRREGWIAEAILNEEICDAVYQTSIKPYCDCW